jgi:glycerol-3-phosphate acyltransferase PlsY
MLTAVSPLVTLVPAAALGYLVGSIPVANLLARRAGAADLRTVGDENPGYWNAKQQLGRADALPVFVGDVAKGAVAAGVAGALVRPGHWWVGYVGAGAAMVGHSWPVFADFRGGRGVLTFVGAALVLSPAAATVAIGVTAGVWAATRRFDHGARAGIVAYPFVQFALEGRYRTAATGALMTLIGARFLSAA